MKQVYTSNSLKKTGSLNTNGFTHTEKNVVPPSGLESEAIKYVLDMKYLSAKQLKKRFNLTPESLIDRGFLTTKDQQLSEDSLVRVTTAGHAFLKGQNPGLVIAEPIKSIWTPRINHDLRLVDLRIRFEELNFISKWYSDHMLKESGYIKRAFLDLPDAVCKKRDGSLYFLELEISQKSFKDYEARIDLYSRVLEQTEIKEQNITGVIFICTDEKVIEIIRERLPKEDKRFSCLNIRRYLPEYKDKDDTDKNQKPKEPLKGSDKKTLPPKFNSHTQGYKHKTQGNGDQNVRTN